MTKMGYASNAPQIPNLPQTKLGAFAQIPI
jgi:hypothetical protein